MTSCFGSIAWNRQLEVTNCDLKLGRQPDRTLRLHRTGRRYALQRLRSPRAVQVNIAIMRAFVRLREMLLTNAELARKLADWSGNTIPNSRPFSTPSAN